MAAALPPLTALPVRAQRDAARLLTGFPTGAVDVVARMLVEPMQVDLGRPFTVESHPGASGRLAVQALKAARADGNTLLVAPHGPMTLFPHVFRQLGYDPEKDFVPLAQLAAFDFALGASNAVPAQNLAELRQWARTQPDGVTFCSPGVGTSPHFLGEHFGKLAGLKLLHVPFKSPSEILPAVIGDHVSLAVLPMSDLQEAARDGKLKILAIMGAQRTPLAPQLPTFVESGIDLQLTGWIGVYAQAGVPPDTLAGLESAAIKAAHSPAMRARLQAAGLVATGLPGAELARLQARETRFWADMVRRSGFAPAA